jgi:hypothetical protein
VYATDATAAKVFRIDAATGASTDFVAATGTSPMGIALAGDGSVWVSVTGASQVKQFDTSGALLRTVGTGIAGWVDGPPATAQMVSPIGIAVVGSNVYVNNLSSSQSSSQNGLRVIDAATGNVTTLLGYLTSTTTPTLLGLKPGYLNSDNSGAISSKSLIGAVIYAPQGLSANADGDLLVSTPNSIYQIVAPANQ